MKLVSVAALLASAAALCAAGPSHSNRALAPHIVARDASTDMSKLGPPNREGENHSPLRVPAGAKLKSIAVGNNGERVQTFWTANANDAAATHAFIMIHGKLRNGNTYWTTMNNVLQSAVQSGYTGAPKNAIVVAPELFSTKLNSGQYTSRQLAWDDTNAWQAGDPANHPSGTRLTSFDAIDALVNTFADRSVYPSLRNVTVVGHGGGGQMIQRYAAVGRDPPANVHVRYIHGDASSAAYFTKNRPSVDPSVASKSTCPRYNDWRYGFDQFTGTSEGLKTPKEYFRRYITRDVVSLVGLQDVDAGGDQYCMALLQGGSKRRDRNLAFYKYVNTLARTNEDVAPFYGNFGPLPDWSDVSNRRAAVRLVVIRDADHDANAVFTSSEGRAALFRKALPTGWRPAGWQARPSF